MTPVEALTELDAKKEIKSLSMEIRIADAQYYGDDNPVLTCLLYTSPSPRDQRGSRMPSSA